MKLLKTFVTLALITSICLTMLTGCLSFLAMSSGGYSSNSGTSSTSSSTHTATVSTTVSCFSGDCGIKASAKIEDNIINYPEIEITVTNTTNKEIAAIQFYAVPYDVYGDEINGIFTQRKLYTDNPISAKSTETRSWQLLDQSIKTVTLYVYSVYFSDGTEWGNRDASGSEIRAGAPTITVTVNP